MLGSRAGARAFTLVVLLSGSLAAASAAAAQEATSVEPTAADYEELRDRIRTLRHRVNWVRVDRCYQRRTWPRPVRAIPRDELAGVRAATRALLERTRNLSRRCPASYSWNIGPRRAVHVWRWRQTSQSRCILRMETGSPPRYGTHTGNGYHGAWQANIDFARSYARLSVKRRFGLDAHGYPRWAQDAMAHRAYHARNGWNPWPWSASKCGLPQRPDFLR